MGPWGRGLWPHAVAPRGVRLPLLPVLPLPPMQAVTATWWLHAYVDWRSLKRGGGGGGGAQRVCSVMGRTITRGIHLTQATARQHPCHVPHVRHWFADTALCFPACCPIAAQAVLATQRQPPYSGDTAAATSTSASSAGGSALPHVLPSVRLNPLTGESCGV